jgi:hypothetical protein
MMTAICVELVVCRTSHDLIYRSIHCTYAWCNCTYGESFPRPW